jgi:thiol-disulfide isomerase/thioredoxin
MMFINPSTTKVSSLERYAQFQTSLITLIYLLMNTLRHIFIPLVLMISYHGNAQEHSIILSDTHVSQFGKGSDLVSFSPVSKLNSKTISNRSASADLRKLPSNETLKNPAHFFLYFSGVKNSVFGNEIAVLMDDYLSDTPILFIDSNGNLDFTDDGAPVSLTNETMVKLKNSGDESRKLHYQLARSKVSSENAPRMESRYAAQFTKNELIPANLWVTNQRLSVNLTLSEIAGQKMTILLMDGNADGLYSFDPDDEGDRIALIEGHLNSENDLTEYLRLGEPIDHNAVFTLYGKNYRFSALTQTQLTISSTTKDTKSFFKKGEDISNLEITLIDGKTISVKDYLDGKTPLLLDVGGTWCGGCVAQEPIIKALAEKKSVKVIGIFGNDTKERVEKYVKTHQLNWPVALMSESFKEAFRIDSYPTYILVSPEGKIIFMTMSADNVVESLK